MFCYKEQSKCNTSDKWVTFLFEMCEEGYRAFSDRLNDSLYYCVVSV